VLGVTLLVGTGGLARMNTRASAPPAASPAPAAGDLRARVLELLEASRGAPREEAWRQLGPEALPVLSAVLGDARAPASVRASAASALGRYLGLEAIPTLISRLVDREDQVREAAAVALGRLGGQQARQALEDRLPLEERPLVREALQRGLTLVEP
jgi:HEAT repeat protein